MEFCNCGGIIESQKEDKNIKMVCRACGKASNKKIEMKITSAVASSKETVIDIGKGDDTGLPKVKNLCQKCENQEAYWWTQQTRSVDEPQTRFFRCTKCNYTWREYE